MKTKYGGSINKPVPVTQPIPGRESEMIQNAAGGYGFKREDVDQFRTWLILGSESRTFYETSEDLTSQNVESLKRLLANAPEQVVATILEVRRGNMALKQSPALFALAVAANHPATKQDALAALREVCKNASQLFEFVAALRDISGGDLKWNRSRRTAISKWYLSKSVDDLSYQMVKYRNRNGFSHADLIMLAHLFAESKNTAHEQLFAWVKAGVLPSDEQFAEALPNMKIDNRGRAIEARKETFRLAENAILKIPKVGAFERLQAAQSGVEAARIIREYRMPREAVPTTLLNDVSVWEALIEDMPYEAMIRNLNKMTSLGMVGNFGSPWVDRIADQERITKSRVHPMRILIALKQYEQGHGLRGSLTWTPARQVIDALNDAFYRSFTNVEPLEQNIVIAVDVSGSMRGARVAGIENMLSYEVAAAMAMVYARANPRTLITAFDTQMHGEAAKISPNQRLTDVMKAFSGFGGGGTNCGLVFEWMTQNKIEADGVLMISDNETWKGRHITDVKQRGIRFFNIQTSSARARLTDPNDTLSMEVGGFSADTVQVANLFFKGLI